MSLSGWFPVRRSHLQTRLRDGRVALILVHPEYQVELADRVLADRLQARWAQAIRGWTRGPVLLFVSSRAPLPAPLARVVLGRTRTDAPAVLWEVQDTPESWRGLPARIARIVREQDLVAARVGGLYAEPVAPTRRAQAGCVNAVLYACWFAGLAASADLSLVNPEPLLQSWGPLTPARMRRRVRPAIVRGAPPYRPLPPAILVECARIAEVLPTWEEGDWCGRAADLVASFLETTGIWPPCGPTDDATGVRLDSPWVAHGGCMIDPSHTYLALPDLSILDPTIRQFRDSPHASEEQRRVVHQWPHDPAAPSVALVRPGDPFYATMGYSPDPNVNTLADPQEEPDARFRVPPTLDWWPTDVTAPFWTTWRPSARIAYPELGEVGALLRGESVRGPG